MLVSLTYTSQATSPLSEDSLKLLVDSAAAKNKVLDVTGALVYLNGTIVQTLEGRMATVTKLYNRVAKDRRHERVTLVLVRSLKEREYGSWGMIQATLGDSSEVHSVLRSMMLTMRAAFDVVDRYVQPAVTSLLRRAIEPSEVEAEVGDSCILVAGITGLRQDDVLPFTTSDFVSACGAFYDVVVEHVAATWSSLPATASCARSPSTRPTPRSSAPRPLCGPCRAALPRPAERLSTCASLSRPAA